MDSKGIERDNSPFDVNDDAEVEGSSSTDPSGYYQFPWHHEDPSDSWICRRKFEFRVIIRRQDFAAASERGL
jgi:hypothetical protein